MAKILLLTLLVASDASELILDGGDEGWSQWYRSVDGVMGGRSSISVQRDGNVLEATGEIVTAGGGFAGMYTRLDDVDASNFAGLRVTYEALPAGQAAGSASNSRRCAERLVSTKLRVWGWSSPAGAVCTARVSPLERRRPWWTRVSAADSSSGSSGQALSVPAAWVSLALGPGPAQASQAVRGSVGHMCRR